MNAKYTGCTKKSDHNIWIIVMSFFSLQSFYDDLQSRLFWQRCVQVMRLGSPIGWILLALPGFWGYAWLGVQGSSMTLVWIVLGSIWARSLGCFYNDWVDRDLDSLVHRTCHRPLVGHAPSLAMLSVMGSLFVAGAVFFMVFLPISCTFIAVLGGLGTLVYPWAKRFTQYPQVLLAAIFNLSVFMPACIQQRSFVWGLALLYIYGMLWTLSYDTLYAFQDLEDDKKAGIGSLAVRLGYDWGRWVLFGLIVVRFVLLAVLARYAGSLGWSASAGISAEISGGLSASAPGATLFHYAFLLILMMYQLWQWFRWDLENPTLCGAYFRNAPQEGYGTTLWLIALAG